MEDGWKKIHAILDKTILNKDFEKLRAKTIRKISDYAYKLDSTIKAQKKKLELLKMFAKDYDEYMKQDMVGDESKAVVSHINKKIFKNSPSEILDYLKNEDGHIDNVVIDRVFKVDLKELSKIVAEDTLFEDGVIEQVSGGTRVTFKKL